MNASTKIPITRGELKEALIEQISLLQAYCSSYDKGELAFSKPMATSLRVLLHEKAKSSSSLLGQLGLRSGRFFSVAPDLNPKNLLTECNLTMMRVSNEGAIYLPQLEFMPGSKRKPFPEWWTRSVVKGLGGVTLSRMDIVRAVTDMDGGAHVDRSITRVYADFRSGALLGWNFLSEGKDPSLVSSPQYACIRAIAHETLLTLDKYASWSFKSPYEAKALA